jgi:hypothetical protein
MRADLGLPRGAILPVLENDRGAADSRADAVPHLVMVLDVFLRMPCAGTQDRAEGMAVRGLSDRAGAGTRSRPA